MEHIKFEALVKLCENKLLTLGYFEANASYIAISAVTAESMGIKTHGLRMVTSLIQAPLIKPTNEPIILKEKGAVCMMDGNFAAGPVAIKKAVEIGIEKSSLFGVSIVNMKDSFWLGALSVHLLPVIEKGLMAVLYAQNSNCKDSAPIGGVVPALSTNPIAYAVPLNPRPILADFSSSTISFGKTNQMIQNKELATEEIFLSKEGEYSKDPNVVPAGGSILLLGGKNYGYKGYALSLMVESFTALAGGKCNNPELENRQNFSLHVYDPEFFSGTEYLQAELSAFKKRLQETTKISEKHEIRFPGDRAFQSLEIAKKEGLSIDSSILNKLS